MMKNSSLNIIIITISLLASSLFGMETNVKTRAGPAADSNTESIGLAFGDDPKLLE